MPGTQGSCDDLSTEEIQQAIEDATVRYRHMEWQEVSILVDISLLFARAVLEEKE